MSEVACMGGWCPVRNSCGHYRAEHRTEPAENLCRDEGGMAWIPIKEQREAVEVTIDDL